ncbi:MAG: hypothetical protein HRF49_05205 [bacterium]|jgi:hypothetical protein
MSNVRTVLPREAYEGALSFDESRKFRQKPPRVYESVEFSIKWRIFLFLTIAGLAMTLFGIAYLATQVSIKQYRLQQLEESTRNLEVQISQAQAQNLGVRRDIFFNTGLQTRLGLEYPASTLFVYHKPVEGGASGEELVRTLYGAAKPEVKWGSYLFKY